MESFAEARKLMAAGRYNDAQKILQSREDLFDTLPGCESLLAAWKAKGYLLPELEDLHSPNADEIRAVFRKTEQSINRLETIQQDLESKKNLHPDLFKQPETAGIVLSLEQNLKNPAMLDTAENNYQRLNNALHQGDEKRALRRQVYRYWIFPLYLAPNGCVPGSAQP